MPRKTATKWVALNELLERQLGRPGRLGEIVASPARELYNTPWSARWTPRGTDMALSDPYYDSPGTIAGRAFEFVSGDIVLQGGKGVVVRVEAAANAVGRSGHVVIHTLQDGKTYRTRWSYFREHAELIEGE